MLLLKLILDDWSVQETLEGVKELELSNDGVRVIETLSKDGSDSSLELLNSLSELVEVIVEFSLLDVHDIIWDTGELLNSLGELSVNLNDRCR